MSRILRLQIGRACAATSVVIVHTLHEAQKLDNISPSLTWLFKYVPFGSGVDVFFAISGFFMYYISKDKLSEKTYPLKFFENRFIRIAPIYWFYTTVMVMILIALPSQFDTATLNYAQIIRSYIFLPGLSAANGDPILALGWTLNLEMFFYAVFAIFILLFRSRAPIFTALFLIVFALSHGLFIDTIYILEFWSKPIILNFAVGMGLAALYSRGARLTRPMGIVAITASILLFLGLTHINLDAWGDYRDIPFGVAACLFVAGMGLVPDAPRQGPLGRSAVLVGDASYTLYLSHPFILTATFILCQRLPILRAGGGWIYVLGTVALCVLASIIGYFLLERPMVSFVRDRLAGRPRVESVPAIRPARD